MSRSVPRACSLKRTHLGAIGFDLFALILTTRIGAKQVPVRKACAKKRGKEEDFCARLDRLAWKNNSCVADKSCMERTLRGNPCHPE
jgi:hypothetical protein